ESCAASAFCLGLCRRAVRYPDSILRPLSRISCEERRNWPKAESVSSAGTSSQGGLQVDGSQPEENYRRRARSLVRVKRCIARHDSDVLPALHPITPNAASQHAPGVETIEHLATRGVQGPELPRGVPCENDVHPRG